MWARVDRHWSILTNGGRGLQIADELLRLALAGKRVEGGGVQRYVSMLCDHGVQA